MRTVFLKNARVGALSVLIAVAACAGADDTAPESDTTASPAAHNTLTAEEAAAGWQLVFDGTSTAGLRGYGREDMPESWTVNNGELALGASSGNMDGGDIITDAEFTDFEMVFDFKVGPEGNSGVFYRVKETDGAGLWQVAAEYQVLDDPAYIAMGTMDMRTHLTGDNYEFHEAEVRPLNPTGDWNTGRIVVQGNQVEHWLNGQRTVAYELYSDDWNQRLAAGKFAVEEHYARAPMGSIGFQDHGTPVWYRNIKIRPIQ